MDCAETAGRRCAWPVTTGMPGPPRWDRRGWLVAGAIFAVIAVTAGLKGPADMPMLVGYLGGCDALASWVDDVVTVSSAAILLPLRRLRVLVCDDQDVYRAGVCAVLESTPHIVVVGQTASAREAFELSVSAAPRLALVSSGLGPDALPLVQRLSRAGLRVIVLGLDSPTDAELVEVIRSGAVGYLTREVSTARLLQSVDAAGVGRA